MSKFATIAVAAVCAQISLCGQISLADDPAPAPPMEKLSGLDAAEASRLQLLNATDTPEHKERLKKIREKRKQNLDALLKKYPARKVEPPARLANELKPQPENGANFLDVARAGCPSKSTAAVPGSEQSPKPKKVSGLKIKAPAPDEGTVVTAPKKPVSGDASKADKPKRVTVAETSKVVDEEKPAEQPQGRPLPPELPVTAVSAAATTDDALSVIESETTTEIEVVTLKPEAAGAEETEAEVTEPTEESEIALLLEIRQQNQEIIERLKAWEALVGSTVSVLLSESDSKVAAE